MQNFHCRALIRFFVVLIAVLTLSYRGSIAYADEVPGYMEGFIGNGIAMNKAESDQENVPALDHGAAGAIRLSRMAFQDRCEPG